MAVQLQLLVTPGTRDQFDELDARVGRAMSDGGMTAQQAVPDGHNAQSARRLWQ